MRKVISVLLLGAVLTGCCCHGHRHHRHHCHKAVSCAPACATTCAPVVRETCCK